MRLKKKRKLRERRGKFNDDEDGGAVIATLGGESDGNEEVGQSDKES